LSTAGLSILRPYLSELPSQKDKQERTPESPFERPLPYPVFEFLIHI